MGIKHENSVIPLSGTWVNRAEVELALQEKLSYIKKNQNNIIFARCWSCSLLSPMNVLSVASCYIIYQLLFLNWKVFPGYGGDL